MDIISAIKLKKGFRRSLAELPEFSKNLQFGLSISFKTYLAHVLPCRLTKETQNTAICSSLESLLSNELDKAKSILDYTEQTENLDYPVWVCWFTGIENSPEIVRACFSSIRQYLPSNAVIHVITLENYKDYFELPEYCLRKYKSGAMSAAALSDIFRACLLSKFGGLWLDATILVSKPIPKVFFNLPMFTLKSKKHLAYWNEPSEGKWCNFIWYSKFPENPLFVFLRDGLLKYWEKYDKVIEYLLPDYIIRVAYTNVPSVRKMMDELKSNTEDFWFCMNHMGTTFSEELWNEVKERSAFNKLTYKIPWRRTDEEGNETLYSFILRTFHE